MIIVIRRDQSTSLIFYEHSDICDLGRLRIGGAQDPGGMGLSEFKDELASVSDRSRRRLSRFFLFDAPMDVLTLV